MALCSVPKHHTPSISSLDKWVYNTIVLDIERGWYYGMSPEGSLLGGPEGESLVKARTENKE